MIRSSHMNYVTKTHLILPFNHKLMVSNGGRNPETNNHNRPPDKGPQNQIYAYDFRTDNTGKETKLQDYPVFGIEVISPADGKITQVIDGSFDCEPGEFDRSVGVGNAVMIDHNNGEFSFLCHLKHSSICVKVGDKISQGERIGLCGNSGNTSQPHIHYHLQDAPLLHKSGPLPAQFAKILVNGKVKKRHEPVRFDIVSNS